MYGEWEQNKALLKLHVYDKARVRERLKHFLEATIVSVSTCIRSINVVISHTTSLFFSEFHLSNADSFRVLYVSACVLNSLSLSQWILCVNGLGLLFIYEFLFLETTDFIVSGSVNCWMCASLVEVIQWFNVYVYACVHACVCLFITLISTLISLRIPNR